jgi:sugar phosphate isomerase/epimerase
MNYSPISILVIISTFVPLLQGEAAQPKSPFFALCMDMQDEKKRSIDEQNEMLRDLGFDGVAHLWLDGLEERAASAKKNGLAVTQIYFQVNLAAEQPFDGRLAEFLPFVKDQGTQLALLINGAKPSDDSFDDKAVGIIQKIVDIAEPQGVHVVLYPHANYWNEKIADCVRIAERFPNKKVGVMFNLCHWTFIDKNENLESVLRLAMPYLMAVTINGSDTPEEIQAKTGAAMGASRFQPLDAGSFDQAKLLKILDNLGYCGPIGLQCFGIPGDARIHLERSMKKWKALRP